jgi:hypothetical protein
VEGIIVSFFDDAVCGNAFKGVIPEIEQEMPTATGGWGNGLPVLRRIQQLGITLNDIELAPLRRGLAEAALTAVPAVVIGGSEAVPFASREAEHTDLAFFKFGKLKGTDKEFQYQIPAQDFDNRVGNIRLGIPAFVKLVKPWFHMTANAYSSDPGVSSS